jgi:hypothetical protein
MPVALRTAEVILEAPWYTVAGPSSRGRCAHRFARHLGRANGGSRKERRAPRSWLPPRTRRASAWHSRSCSGNRGHRLHASNQRQLRSRRSRRRATDTSAALRVHAQVEVLGEAGFNGAVGQAATLCPSRLGAHMLMIESEGITEQNGAPTSSLGSCPYSGSNKSCSRPPTQHLHLVHQELRDRRQPLRRPQPNRPARVPARRHLGHARHLAGCSPTAGERLARNKTGIDGGTGCRHRSSLPL